jgi:hypothetical protein
MDGLADDPYAEGSKKQRAIVNNGKSNFYPEIEHENDVRGPVLRRVGQGDRATSYQIKQRPFVKFVVKGL